MKKIVSLLLAAVLALSLVGCSLSDVPTKEENSEAVGTNKRTEETFGLNETAVFENLKFTATEIKETNGKTLFTPESGNVFVGVKFTVENVSDEEQSVSSILLFDAYADDIKCDYSLGAVSSFEEGTIDGSVAPGKKIIGWYAVEIPADWKNLELDVKATLMSNNSAKFVFEK